MSWLFGGGVQAVATGVKEVAQVFRANAENDAAREHQEFASAISQFGQEFRAAPMGWFDGAVDGLNRVPRPALALGCLGLFAYAMADPIGFAARMQGLALVPEPLWWLLGAIVSFYFGARELHYLRENRRVAVPTADVAEAMRTARDLRTLAAPPAAETAAAAGRESPADNPAIAEFWARAA
ncbi:MAG TPA: holin family protein [Paracoccaceae bacterium]|nr:holin family protein [Paracoccaceae bacterium]